MKVWFVSAVLIFLAAVPAALAATPLSSCAYIDSPDVYVLTQSRTTIFDCFIIDSDDVIIDLGGYTISGDRGLTDQGIYAACSESEFACNNITVRNGRINNFGYGVYLTGAANVSVENVLLDYNKKGVYMTDCNGSRVINSLIQNSTSESLYMSSGSSEISQNSFNNISNITIYNTSAPAKIIYGTNITISNISCFFGSSCLRIENSENVSARTISSNMTKSGGIGISFASMCDFRDIILSNGYIEAGNGMMILESNRNRFTNITAEYNYKGIDVESSSDNIFSGIDVNHNADCGISIAKNVISEYTSYRNTITGLDSSFNTVGLCIGDAGGNLPGVDNTVTSGSLWRNVHATSPINRSNAVSLLSIRDNHNPIYNFTSVQYGVTGQPVSFQINLSDINRDGQTCPTCSYGLSLYPTETSFQNSKSGNIVTGSFTPTRTGLYSLVVDVDYGNGNTEMRKHAFLINSTEKSEAIYHFRNSTPTHGQALPVGIGGQFRDSGSLLSQPAGVEEIRICGIWVQYSPDEQPKYMFPLVTSINASVWYSLGIDGVLGIQRYASYDTTKDITSDSTLSSGSRVFAQRSFFPYWQTDSPWSWYFISIKLVQNGALPIIHSSSIQPSIANISYTYPSTPAIAGISNDYADILSATMPNATSNKANITIEGSGQAKLSFQMPNATAIYSVIKFDDANCGSGACLIEYNQNGMINLTLSLSSIHRIYVSEACIPNCAGKNCGDDGCGGSCGSCGVGWTCQSGTCTENEQPEQPPFGGDSSSNSTPGFDAGLLAVFAASFLSLVIIAKKKDS